ncbi:hypothetical protein PSACC_02204 [Paramicrosporidium saccamoebae]|uniref:Uncharacterized protein n=1 Tax=Paramicrosporidium saccamoebae TaxID=1246581 RepID=A0A2H9TJI1_9FUNG|nr:hypothetical protein PSACC_02204 [Paramicrosporidium saccamoebae]
MLECVNFNYIRAVELVGVLFGLPHFLNQPLWTTPWSRPLITAISSRPTLHILLNSQMLNEQYMGLVPTTGFRGILWVEGSDFSKFSDVERLENMRIHRHADLLADVPRPWLLAEDAWRFFPVNLNRPIYDEYLHQRYIRSNGMEQQLLYVRQWQRKLNSLSTAVVGVTDDATVLLLDAYLHDQATAIEVIYQIIGMVAELEKKEASAWLLDTFLVLLPKLSKSEQLAILAIILEQMDPNDFAPMNFLALLNSPYILWSPNQQHPHQWKAMFYALMRYYPGEVLPYEPYETRYVRWQALYVLFSSVKRLPFLLTVTEVAATMGEGLFKHSLTLPDPVTLVYLGKTHMVRTLLEMCTWYLQVVREGFCLYSHALKEHLLVSSMHTRAVFNAVRYQFALTGKWNSLVNPNIMHLWWPHARLDFAKPDQVRTAYDELLVDAEEMITSWMSVEYQIFTQHFHLTDPVFRSE